MLNCRGILKQKRMKCLRVIVKRKRWYFKTWNKLLKKELMRIQAWLLLRRSSQRGLLLKVLEQNVSKSFHRNKFCSTSNLLLRLFFVCKCLVPYLVIFTFLKMPENNLLGGGGGVWYQIVKQFHKFGSCSHSTSFDVRNLDPNVFSEGALEGLSVFDPPTSFRISAFWNTPEMSLFKGAK